MADYFVGDLQGCREPLERLLDQVKFKPSSDRLYLVGDLVNRGPDSLGTLRLVKSLGSSVCAVLGNHDLNTLAVAEGLRETKPRDTIAALLDAEDADELLTWLRHLPLLIETDEVVMVHAGIYPRWKLKRARRLAAEVERCLKGENYRELLRQMYGMLPNQWSKDLDGWDRLRFIINCFTRMRYVGQNATLDFEMVGAPGSQPDGFVPWYEYEDRKPLKKTVVFGHWSTLGARQEPGVLSLDSGCVWGQRLTAVRWRKEKPRFISVSCPGR